MYLRSPLTLFLRHKRTIRFVFLHAAACFSLALLSDQGTRAMAQDNRAPHASKTAASNSDVARGKYLVEGVAMCGQCHTPRDSDGNPDPKRPLQGAPVPFLSPSRDPNWPVSVPRIGGTPPADDADMVRLLTTGIWITGGRLRPPMPQFRMDRSDAEAVVAYLKSLTPQD